ncbi:MAG: FHA domain-containing protein [Bdellovibrionaceae bacterium]|nr:FHA domain-containing protein [Pseudobdellovibrionaceae bacterium]
MNQLAPRTSFNNSLSTETNQDSEVKRYFLRINKGFEKGAVFQIKSNEVLIGRDPANHIQLKNDAKISRKHLRLIFSNGKYIAQDVTKNNFITINGIKVKQAELKHNQVIGVGDHDLQFIVSSDITKNKTDAAPAAGGNKNFKVIMIVLILLGMGYFLFFEEAPKSGPMGPQENIENTEIVEKRIDSIDDTISELDQAIKSSNKFDEIGRSAHSIYIQGKRDFDRGKYSYAITSFQAVLALNPDHAEARRYLRLAEQYFNDILEIQFKDGLANKDANRYDLCKGAMKNIMNLINDPAHERYREAKKIFMECDLKVTSGGGF